MIGRRKWSVGIHLLYDLIAKIIGHSRGVGLPLSNWRCVIFAAQDAERAKRFRHHVAGHGEVWICGQDVADGCAERCHVILDAGVAPCDGVVKRYLAVQVVIPGQVVIHLIHLIDCDDIGRAGEVAIRGEHRVLVADEPHGHFLWRVNQPIRFVLLGQGVQNPGQGNRRERDAGQSVPPTRLARTPGESRHDIRADEQIERDDDKDKAVFLMRLCGMDEQDQGDEREREPIAAQIAQGQRDAEQDQSPAGEQEPQ